MWNFDRYPAELTLCMDDGRDRRLAFLPDGRFRWEGADCEGQLADFGEDLFFLTLDPEAAPRVNLTLVLDMAQGLVTLVTCRQGVNPRRPTYISTELLPGYISLPGREAPEKRHGFTDALAAQIGFDNALYLIRPWHCDGGAVVQNHDDRLSGFGQAADERILHLRQIHMRAVKSL